MLPPKIEVFMLFNLAGAPLTGVVPTFLTYKDDLGVNVAQPAISEVGGGFYKFTPVFSPNTRGIGYVIDGTVAASPRYVYRYMDVSDWWIADIKTYQFGRWKINTSTNKLEIYAEDGVTLLTSYDLKDAAGNATSTQIFDRIPV